MSAAARHAVRLGTRRGLTEVGQSLRSAQDVGFTLFMSVAVLGYLLVYRFIT